MRPLLLAAVFAAAAAMPASADPPNARTVYVERLGLIETDARCDLFSAPVRSALEAGVAQARGTLLREGWTNRRMRELDDAVASAASARTCNDTRTVQAAAEARAAFERWLDAPTMEFTGWRRTWTARRTVGVNGWRLSQVIDAPVAATFGVRERDGVQRLTLTVAYARGAAAPTSARLVMRDAARAGATEVTLPQRISYGLEAGAPSAAAARGTPSTRSIERLDSQRSQAAFVFPDSAFAALLALDPRESVVIEVQTARGVQRLLVEVGDVSAARAFIALRP